MAKKILINLTIGVVVGILLLVANATQFVERIELGLYNFRFESFRGTRPPNPNILIVTIDDSSIEEMGPFPWKRDVYADLIEKLNQYHAKFIAFDVMFATPSQFPEADAILEDVLQKNPNTLIASKFDFGLTSKVSGSGANKEATDKAAETTAAASYTVPFFEEGAQFAFVNYPHDSDASVRKGPILRNIALDDLLPTKMTINKTNEPGFPLQIIRSLEPQKGQRLMDKYSEQDVWINFAGPPEDNTFPKISFYLVNQLGNQLDKKAFTTIAGKRPEELFRDKIVLVGATAEVLHDNFDTPFVTENKMPGVEIHANMLDTLWQDIPYTRTKTWHNQFLIMILALLTALGLVYLKPLGGFAFALSLGAVYSVINIYFFQLQRLFIDWFSPLVAIGLVYTAVFAYRFLVEDREKRRIRQFFKSYVSPQLVEELLKDPHSMPTLKSERKVVTILFSDIAGFTSMSETLPPDEVEQILNEYLTAMSEIVFDNNGTLDKYIGDAVMAIWGNVGPNNPKTDAYKGVNTAIQMQRKLAELREKWLAEGMVPLQIRIGVNTGEALVGNFGSPQKMDYTVIGDAVNTAARLEGLNKEYGTSILISHNCYELVSDRLNARPCGEAKVKGKEELVTIYEAIGWKEEKSTATEMRDTKWIKTNPSETQWKQ